MAAKFKLEIEMGNDAMQSEEDVVEALRVIAGKLAGGKREGVIRDVNGNTVGTFGFKEPVPHYPDADGCPCADCQEKRRAVVRRHRDEYRWGRS